MKTTKNFFFVSLLIGCILSCALFVQGQHVKSSSANMSSSLQLFVYAGGDATICSNDNFQTQGVSTFLGVTYWETSGDGVFDNPFSLQTIYTPGEQDIANGEISLRLFHLENDSSKSKVVSSDSMNLTFGNCWVVKGLER